MNQGSIWRKWDFHVHTKWTNKNDLFKSSSMDDFFYTFFKKAYENQIEAIGVTDYFSVDRYLDAIEYQKGIENKQSISGNPLFLQNEIDFIKKIFLFPNVELRMLPSTDKGRLINIHCIFDPSYISELEDDFFSNIENQDHFKMNRHGFISYGKSLDPLILDEQKQFEKGLDHFVIDPKSIKDLLSKSKRFRDNSLLVVSNSNKDGASAIQQHYDLFEHEYGSLDGVRRSIYCISDAVFSTNIKDVKYFSGKKSEGNEGYNELIHQKEIQEVIENRGSLKSCLVGCDAHTENDLFKRFTWIKADLTFEGLRQICFEPEQRVRIQDDKPDFKEDKLVIEKVQFISPNNVFSTNPIYLNPNLNVIIGGKSSGKSILLYSIAKTLLADNKNLKNDDGSYKYELDKVEKQFDFEITTKGSFSQRLNRNSNENSILPQVKYIPQNHLVKLAEPELNKTGATLNKLVRDLIIEDDESNGLYQEFLNTVKANDKQRNSLVDYFLEIQEDIKVLEIELKNKSNKDVLKRNIETNTAKIDELNKSTGLTEEEIEQYKTLLLKQEENNANLQKFNRDFSSIKSFTIDFVQLIKSLKQKKDSLLNTIELKELKEFYEQQYSSIDTLFEESMRLEQSIELITKEDGKKYFKSVNKFTELLQVINDDKKKISEQIAPFLKNDAIKKSIEELRKSIENDKKALLEIDTLSLKIQGKKKTLDDTKNEIFELYKTNHQEYINIITALKERTTELEKDGLGIEGKAKCNFSKLWKKVYEISDGRTASYNQYPQLLSNKNTVDEIDFEAIFYDIKVLFEDIISNKYALTSRTTMMNALKIILDDYFFDYWEITYKNDRLGEMSTGKASFVILMLIIGLSKSKAPILIDQPEDNLDNRSITSDLVNYLRNKKLERQIIIVTHNANIVVNADAENVIVANQKGQNDDHSTSQFTFDYINGSIENSFDKIQKELDILKSMGIRQHIADIVEGGKEAFIKREKKYRFN